MAAAKAAGRTAPARPPPVVGGQRAQGFARLQVPRSMARGASRRRGCVRPTRRCLGRHPRRMYRGTWRDGSARGGFGVSRATDAVYRRRRSSTRSGTGARGASSSSRGGHRRGDPSQDGGWRRYGRGRGRYGSRRGCGRGLNAEGGNVAGAAGARLWLVPCFVRRFARWINSSPKRCFRGAATRRTRGAGGGGSTFEAQQLPWRRSHLEPSSTFCKWRKARRILLGSGALARAPSPRARIRGPLTEALRRLIQRARAVMREDGRGIGRRRRRGRGRGGRDKAKEAAAAALPRTVPTGSPPRWRRAKRPPWRNTRATSSRFSSTSSSPRPRATRRALRHRGMLRWVTGRVWRFSRCRSSSSRRTSRTPPTRSPRAATRVPRDDAFMDLSLAMVPV